MILSCHTLCICVFIYLDSCTIHFIYCFPIILFILHFYTCTIVYFHVICVHLVLFISCYSVLFIYFIYICTFLFYLSYTLCYCILSVLFLCLYTYFHIKLYYTSCSCNCLYFHCIARLCFSYHIISYTFLIHFLCVYFFFFFYIHVCKYLRSGFRK